MLRRITYLLGLVLSTTLSWAQSLQKYQYWIDSDYSKHTSVENTSTDISFSVPLNQLEAGIHFLNFRAFSSTQGWGSYYRYLFYQPESFRVDSPQMVGYEYWLDNDYTKKVYQKGNLTDVALSVPLSNYSSGVHFFNFRTLQNAGRWSPLLRYLFYVPEWKNQNLNVAGYEYWLDGDYSKKVTRSFTGEQITVSVLLNSISEGIHYLNFRVKDSSGHWGSLQRYLFYNHPATNLRSSIVGYRYSFNNQSTFVSVSETNDLNLSNLVIPIPDPQSFASAINGCQYFISENTDSVTLQRKDTASFSIQFKDKAGRWSAPACASVAVSDSISKVISELRLQKSLSFEKFGPGDFQFVKMVVPQDGVYYLRASQSCQLTLFKDFDLYEQIPSNMLLQTYAINLSAGTYYGLMTDVLKDADNPDNRISIRWMLTDNYVPSPEVKFENEQVSITCAQEGAAIYYTLDGTDPTPASIPYTQPFALHHNAVIKVIATYPELADSYVTTYQVESYRVATPLIEFANLKVYISCNTLDAQIFYTIDGSDPLINGVLYTAPVAVSDNVTVKAVARKADFNNSMINTYQVDVVNVRCVMPKFSLLANLLTISSLTDDAQIYYTIDGELPTNQSTLYGSSIPLTHNCTIQAFAMKNGFINSPIATYIVDWFQAEKPTFLFENGILSMSSTTPNAQIHYELGNEMPTAESPLYEGPITLSDNRVVRAIAIAEGFKNSEVTIYTTGFFSCESATFSYDGRYLEIISATPEVSIYYTTDGSNPTEKSTLYTEKVEMPGLCSVRAWVTKSTMNPSEVTTYDLPCFFDGTTAWIVSAGSLEKAFQWCGTAYEINNLIVKGTLNVADLSFLRSLTAVQHLNLTEAIVPNNSLPDQAFAGMPLISVQTPKTLSTAGNQLFEECHQLAAILWNSPIAFSDAMAKGITNKNLLLYVPHLADAPSSIQNVVVNGIAKMILLKDTIQNNFYCPQAFRANYIQYEHEFTQTTIRSICQGWETIALPFDVTEYLHEKNGELAPYLKKDIWKKPFWLYALDESGFMAASEMKANTPYLICMPNDSIYADCYIQAGKVTFYALDAMVQPSNLLQVAVNSRYKFIPNFINKEASMERFVINRNQGYQQNPTGSVFVRNLRGVTPFEGYLTSSASGMAPAYYPIREVATDLGSDIPNRVSTLFVYNENGKTYIRCERSVVVQIYNINGLLVRAQQLIEGINEIENLTPGVYFIAGQKTVVE